MGKTTRKTTEQFINEIFDLVGNEYDVLGAYINAKEKILMRHNICGCSFDATTSNFLSGNRCPVCNGKKTVIGYNDLWTTYPEIAKMLKNSDDGYKYTSGSNRKVEWICPDCNNETKPQTITSVVNSGLRCNHCSDGLSIPFKFVCNVLDSIGVSFETEKIFDWCKNRRYDIFINNNTIIEVNGCQHYEEKSKKSNWDSLEKQQENDKYKKDIALANGISEINYIYIDGRFTDCDFLTKSILNTLSDRYDLSNVDFQNCYINACHSRFILVCQEFNTNNNVDYLCDKYHLSKATIQRYLLAGTKLNLCNYNGMYGRTNKKVICITHNKVFESIKEAGKFYKVDASCISKCCKGIVSHTKNLQWMDYEDYLKSTTSSEVSA